VERTRWFIAVLLCDVAQAVIPRGHYVTVGKSLRSTVTWQ
jgi:hypothetical protein